MKHSNKKISKPVYALLVISFLLFGAIFIYQSLGRKIYTASDAGQIEREFEIIGHPGGSNRHSEIRKSYKLTRQSISSDFLSEADVGGIYEYYNDKFISNGWRCIECAPEASGGRYLKYCKSDMRAFVEIIEKNKGATKYYFGVSKGDELDACQ